MLGGAMVPPRRASAKLSNTKNRTQDMQSKLIILMGILLLGLGLVSGCMKEPQKPQGALSVSELLGNPVYDTELKIYGEVSLLGQLFCPCFELAYGGKEVLVWYDREGGVTHDKRKKMMRIVMSDQNTRPSYR
jgi:hypothetical protein